MPRARLRDERAGRKRGLAARPAEGDRKRDARLRVWTACSSTWIPSPTFGRYPPANIGRSDVEASSGAASGTSYAWLLGRGIGLTDTYFGLAPPRAASIAGDTPEACAWGR